MNKRYCRVRQMVPCALFAALIVAGAFIRVPLPLVPFTLQTLFVMLAGLLLGGKLGALSVLIYIALGLIGLPVFSSGGGIGYIFNPNFGYLIGFAIGAFVTGCIAEKSEKPTLARLFVGGAAGIFVIYFCGMVYYYFMSMFYLGNPIGLWPLFLYCFIMVIPGDILKCIISVLLAKRLYPIISYNPRKAKAFAGIK